MNKYSVSNSILEYMNTKDKNTLVLFYEIFNVINEKIHQYSLLELNQIYMEFNKKGDNVEICDYNWEVDEILKLTKSKKPQSSIIINNCKFQYKETEKIPSIIIQNQKSDPKCGKNIHDNIKEVSIVDLKMKLGTNSIEVQEKNEIKDSINSKIIKNEEANKTNKEVNDSNASKLFLYNDEMPPYLKDRIFKRNNENSEFDPYSVDYLNSYIVPSPKFSNIYNWDKYSHMRVEENENEIIEDELDYQLGFGIKNKKSSNIDFSSQMQLK